jgi:hypothetical protein
MAGFNKIEVVYKCDLKQNQLQDVFKNWEEKPKPYHLTPGEKEDIAQQLHYAKIRYERQT